MTVGSLSRSLTSLQASAGLLAKGDVTKRQQAITDAEQLAQAAHQYFDELCQGRPHASLTAILENTPIEYEIFYQITDVLKNPALRFEFNLKQPLSEASRIMLELFIVQVSAQQVGIDTETVTELQAVYKKNCANLPPDAAITRFDLRCCKAALKTLEGTSGVYKEAAKKHALAMTSGIAMTLLSTSPTPPYVSIAPIVPASVNLICDIYKHKPKLWYRDILSIKLCAPESRLVTLEQYRQMQPKLDKLLPSNTLASYLSQVFGAVINNVAAEAELKDHVFNSEGISLVQFAKYQPKLLKVKKIHKYWETRYHALYILASLRHQDRYAQVSREVISDRMLSRREHGCVKALARRIIAQDAADKYAAWKSPLSNIRDQASEELSSAERSLESIQQELKGIRSSIAELKQSIEEKGHGRQQQAAGDDDDIEVLRSKLAKKLEVEENRQTYEDWLLDRQYILESVGEYITS